MKTRKIIFGLFFVLGLVVFGFVSVNFSSDLLKNKNAFTASLAQDVLPAPKMIEIVEPTPEPEELPVEEEVVVSVAVYSKQDQIDDILEKIDILQRQIADLQALEKVQEEEIALVSQEEVEEVEVIVAPVIYRTSTVGGGRQSYLKVLISEVQISGETDAQQEFVELYNPNDQEIDLTDWYLQRKTKTADSFSSFASSTLFIGKKISAKGYFLIARDGTNYASNITVTSALTDDNSLALKNPNGEISDKVGFGNASDFEIASAINPPADQSIGRKFVDNNEVDADNNLVDFEINIPTPTAQNLVYVAPPPVIEIPIENILISQVQTEGVTVKDEFVELFNPNEVNVDLAGFALKKKTTSGSESNLVSASSFMGTILAQGYFLIAPQNNDDGTKNYMGLTEPDLRYSGKTFSIASGNNVLLYNASKILMDEYIPTADTPTAPTDTPPPLP